MAIFDVPVFCWWNGELKLPRPPLQSVGWVKYYDTAGTLQTLVTTEYLVRTPWQAPGKIERAPGKSWPSYEADRTWPISSWAASALRLGAAGGIGWRACDRVTPTGHSSKPARNQRIRPR